MSSRSGLHEPPEAVTVVVAVVHLGCTSLSMASPEYSSLFSGHLKRRSRNAILVEILM